MTTTAAPRFADLGIRERKRARLRLDLLRHMQDRVGEVGFEEIRVKELAQAADVTEPTFFAQFPTKSALLAYHIHLWRIATILYARRADTEFIRAFFDRTATDIISRPSLWFSITAEIAQGGGVCAPVEISTAERLLFFNDDAEALDVDPVPQGELFAGYLRSRRSDLPVDDIVDGLLAVFYGTPLALGADRLDELPTAFRRSIDALLTDLGKDTP